MTTPAPGIRAEIKFFGGTGHRETFQGWAELTAWLGSPAYTETAHRVRSLTVTAPHPHYPADSDHAPRRRSPIPEWIVRDLPPDMRPSAA